MKTFAAMEKRTTPAVRKARPYVHHPMGLVQRKQQAEIRRILHSTGAQAKLTIGQPNDKYEKEADRVADQVMAMPDAKLQRQQENEEEEETLQTKPLADQITPLVQRQEEPPEEKEEPVQAKFRDAEMLQRMCPECEEEKVQRQPMEEGEEELQAKSNPAETPSITPGLESRINSLKGGGQPLDRATRAFFEPRFGHDFSHVRVHSDNAAGETAKSIHARAFTLGNHVAMGTGEYQPTSKSGQRLLGHELTHVVQQGKDSSLNRFVQCLGANPGCSRAERRIVHQSIYNARGWLLKAIRQLSATPITRRVRRSLRRNFGPTYGVSVNATLIANRLRVAYRELSTVPFACRGAADATCATRPCGYVPSAGSHSVRICRNATLTAGTHWVYQAGCALHEALHSSFSRFTVDEYSGWHGHSSSTPTYPGAGTDPLLNADSYTTLTMDLS